MKNIFGIPKIPKKNPRDNFGTREVQIKILESHKKDYKSF